MYTRAIVLCTSALALHIQLYSVDQSQVAVTEDPCMYCACLYCVPAHYTHSVIQCRGQSREAVAGRAEDPCRLILRQRLRSDRHCVLVLRTREQFRALLVVVSGGKLRFQSKNLKGLTHHASVSTVESKQAQHGLFNNTCSLLSTDSPRSRT